MVTIKLSLGIVSINCTSSSNGRNTVIGVSDTLSAIIKQPQDVPMYTLEFATLSAVIYKLNLK